MKSSKRGRKSKNTRQIQRNKTLKEYSAEELIVLGEKNNRIRLADNNHIDRLQPKQPKEKPIEESGEE